MQSNIQSQWLKLFIMAIMTAIISSSAPAFANNGIYTTKSGVAIKGYDTVAYFVSSKAVKGKKEFSHSHEGNTWLFSNEENKNSFVANPTAYIPQYGGYCAYAAGINRIETVDPRQWVIKNDKLYLNYNSRINKKWKKKVDFYIAKGDAYWPKLIAKKKGS